MGLCWTSPSTFQEDGCGRDLTNSTAQKCAAGVVMDRQVARFVLWLQDDSRMFVASESFLLRYHGRRAQKVEAQLPSTITARSRASMLRPRRNRTGVHLPLFPARLRASSPAVVAKCCVS